ncbi:MAG: PSD1 and planctomycete cytochrome C domain-containing protein [Lacipirellulaceae bacterium]
MLVASCYPLVSTAAERDTTVLFNRDVRPILSENCYFCHGPDKDNRRAELRLDTFEGATEDRGDYAAIVPGKAEASELVARILSNDPDLKMPPSDSVYSLTDQQKETLRRWIEQGAEYQEHWAFRKLERPPVEGEVDGPAAIDTFLERRWRSEQAQPVEEATPRELIRRLSYDLRGLPPTYEEVKRFEADPSMAAFDRLVDQWMDSLEYAEHQAVQWLDLVRWADSSGMVSDEPIASGAYRAYVINAIRDNMPFDRFTIEQLAGDLLPNPTDEQLISSGYNRIVKTNCEAGVIDKEALYALKGEHVRAVGTVWLGLTTGCAECHDHKYDPLTAKDYYSLAAFFDDLVETGVYTPGDRRVPLHYVYQQDKKSELDKRLERQVAELYEQIHNPKDELAAKLEANQSDWELDIRAKLKDAQQQVDFKWIPAVPHAPRQVGGEFDTTSWQGRTARVVTGESEKWKRHYIAESMTGYSKRDFPGKEGAFYAEVYIDPDNPPEHLAVQILHGAYGRMGWKPDYDEAYYWGKKDKALFETAKDWMNPKRLVHLGELPKAGGWVRLRIPKSKFVKANDHECVGMAWAQRGGRVGWGESGWEVRADKAQELRLGETMIRRWREKPIYRMTFEKRMSLPKQALMTAAARRNALQKEIAQAVYFEQSQPELMTQLREMENQLYGLRRESMPVLVSKSGEPKETRLVNRGNFMDTTGPIVGPAVPEFLGSVGEDGKRPTRLDLAQWLVSEENPLTPRVFVNRLWKQFYGRGISETLEDSGGQGDWPSHPELLDWLAAEFVESGWDRNHMVKLLVSTNAYRLSSKPTPDLAKRDPGNRWHARQSRHRHTAEEIRDSALQAAGLLQLTDEVPVASFYPYQPKKYWEVSSKIMWGSRHMLWKTSEQASQYQRTLYTFWKRQNIHPALLAFDAPTRQECTARRNQTNTPGQALTLLNDPQFVEAARALAERTLKAEAVDDAERLRLAFEWTLQREPKQEELALLTDLLREQRRHYKNNPKAAQQLLEVGQIEAESSVDAAELAAWTIVSRGLLNLHEFITRT